MKKININSKMFKIIKSFVLFILLGRGSSRILTNENQKQSPRGNKVIIGDMILTQEQYEFLYRQRKRVGVPVKWDKIFRRWPDNRLPYIIDSSISPPNIAIIKSTISKFNDQMSDCFRIV